MTVLEQDLVSAALRRLRREGLDVALEGVSSADGAVGGQMSVGWPGGHHAFPVVIKTRLTPSAVPLLPRLSGGVLVTDYASPNLRRALADAGWGLVDAAGNASLSAPGLLVRVQGERQRKETVVPVDLPFGKTGLPVTFVLLTLGGTRRAGTQRELAGLASTSLGSTNRVVQTLRSLGYLSGEGELVKQEMLVDRWTEAYIVLRDHLAPPRLFTSDRWASPAKLLDRELPKGVHLSSEAAARLRGSSLRPETVLAYCAPAARAALVKEGRLRPDEAGWVELRKTFWHPDLFGPGARTVPDFLIRADLLAEEDPRLTEVAEEWEPHAYA